MKTIEERAKKAWEEYEYKATGNLYSTCFCDGYEQGAKSEREALTKWNSPECPPDDTREILVKYRTPSGAITFEVGYYVRTKGWYFSSSDYELLPNIIGWREILE